jgi:rhodanese-related sulfurtransferase
MKMKNVKIILPALLIFFSLQGCAQNNPDESLSVKQFKEKINNDSSIVIIDVRTDAELTGPLPKIKGAVHIPVQEIENRVDELEKYKDKEIVVVCRTQNRSSRAVEFLRSKGYDAKYVNGGMQEFYKK